MRIQDALIHLLLKQPFYGYIASSLTPSECSEIQTVSMSMIPVPKLLYNKEWFEGLKEEHALGVVIHELLHLILLHHFRKGNKERQLWAVACDMAVNEHIDSSLLFEDAITISKISEEFHETIPRLKSAETYYDILYNLEDKLSLVENDKEIKVVLKSGQELKANNSTDGDSSEINKNAVKSAISELVEQAHAEGEVPNLINSFLNEIYKANEVNWRNVLKRFLTGKGKAQVRKTCKRESKRFENLPGSKRLSGTDALLALDESGSISDKQLVKFYNEILAIRKITNTSLQVVQFDTECTEPVKIEKYVRKKARIKNGGTDFRPVFKAADKIMAPLLIIFTDGEGPVPETANQKVLWVLSGSGKNPSRFGECVSLNEEA